MKKATYKLTVKDNCCSIIMVLSCSDLIAKQVVGSKHQFNYVNIIIIMYEM